MRKTLSLLYGIISYVVFLVAFLYAVGFVGNLFVQKSIDTGLNQSFGYALFINAVLLGLFAIQHTIMARPGFKKWWTKIIPEEVERSTFVLITSLLLLLLFWKWQPMTGIVWNITNPIGASFLTVVFWIGWLIVFFSTFMINHFDLFGLRQVYLNFQGKEYSQLEFTSSILYKYVRHPIMLGFIIAFWATPTMSLGHLVFAIATTGYIIIGISFEERDLIKLHGKSYQDYRNKVYMLFPFKKG